MGLTKIALKRPVSALIILFTLIAFGVSSLFGFRLGYMPQMDMPAMIIAVPYIGADPELIDSLVVDPIEAVGATISGFENSITTASEDIATIAFLFDYSVDTNEIYIDLKSAVDNVALPEGASDPIIMKMSLYETPMMNISVSAQGDFDVFSFVDDTLAPRINSMSEVADVEVYGGAEKYISVQLNPEKVAQYGLTMQGVCEAIMSYDFEMPLGEVTQGEQNLSISTEVSLDNIFDLQNVSVPTMYGTSVMLSDIATVINAEKAPTTISSYNGYENIALSVISNRDANVPSLASDIRAELDLLRQEYPELSIDITYDDSVNIIDTIMSVFSTMLLSVVLCMFVLFLFFGDIRTSLVVGGSIPLSLVLALIGMSMLNFDLDLLTSIALVISIGMMVDNSIVVQDSIFRVKEQEGNFAVAAYEGCKAVGASVIAATLTTIVVYLPMAFIGGIAAEMFVDFSLTVVFSMLASLLSAIILVPLFFYLLRPTEKISPFTKLLHKIENHYVIAVRKVIGRKFLVVFTAVSLLLASFGLAAMIPMEVITSMPTNVLTMVAEFRHGTDIEVIEEKIKDFEAVVATDERVEYYTLTISGNTATINAQVKEEFDKEAVGDEYLLLSTTMPDFTLGISSDMLASLMGADIGTTVTGHNYEETQAAALDLTEKIYGVPGVLAVNSSVAGAGSTRATIEVDAESASSYGLNPIVVSQMLRQAIVGADVATMEVGADEFDVTVEYPSGTYDNLNAVMNLPFQTPMGTVPLSEIATQTFTESLQTIERVDGKYNININVITTSAVTDEVKAMVNDIVDNADYGLGVTVGEDVISGTVEEQLTPIIKAVFIAIFLVFVVMAVQFESIRFSIMVMTSIMFSMIGSFGLLYLSGEPINDTSTLGILMLVGIVVNNAILFVDTANALRENMPLEEALIESGRMRLRPILMTTLTTILAMIPVALGMGINTEILKGMAIVIIGGLTTSTILILFLLPTFYLIIGRKENSKLGEEAKALV